MMPKSRIQCFFLVPTGVDRLFLRRYKSTSSDDDKCSVHGYHNVNKFIATEERTEESCSGDIHPHNDERWPTHCGCGYEFTDDDKWQLFREEIYRRQDTGEEMIRSDAPVGAMWDAIWYGRKGPDGRSLMVRTPGGDWFIDDRASNCTMRDDNEHRCWVRHGEVPNITVGKNGHTCRAGAGSIAQKTYHGFLRNGYLEEC
jgi:hypothetical protein